MIRQPTPAAELLAYWRECMSGGAPPIHDGLPQCGWYKLRLVKGGPWVSVRIYVDRQIDPESGELLGPETFRAIVGGEARDPARIWTFLTAITREEHERLEQARHSDLTMAATHAAVDLTKEPAIP